VSWVLVASIAVWLAVPPMLLVWSNRLGIPPARPLAPLDRSPAASVVVFGRDPAGLVETVGDVLRSVRLGQTEFLLVGIGRAAAMAAEELASQEPRLRCLDHEPEGPHPELRAAHRGGKAAREDEIVFVRAGTRLAPSALARLLILRRERAVHLLSALPLHRRMDSIASLLMPLKPWLVHALMPLGGRGGGPLRAAADTALIAVSKSGWQDAGGHKAAFGPHDGIGLARAFRRRQLRTGIVDGAGLCWTRAPVGLEGCLEELGPVLDAFGRQRAALVLVLAGQLLPFLLLAAAPDLPTTAAKLAFTGVAAVWIARLLLCFRRGDPVLSAFAQPVAATVLLLRVLARR